MSRLLLALALALLGCADEAPPDVVLVTIDTLRADHLGAYGYAQPISPHIDRLAREGVLVEIAYAPMGATSPSHASLFSGRHPAAHGLVRNGLPFAEEEVAMAERLRDAGYATAAFVSSFPASAELGFGQGFEHFDDDFEGGTGRRIKAWAGRQLEGRFERTGAETVAAVIDWIEEANEPRPLFLWVHLFDPHVPYRSGHAYPVSGGERERLVAQYDAEIRSVDAEVDRLVRAVVRRRRRPPLIVLTSDHGEGLLDHGHSGHNRFLYEEEVRVPLLFHWRGELPAGGRVTQPAHLVDIWPTVASLLGVDAGGEGVGVDLAPLLWGGSEGDADRPVLLQRPYYPAGRPFYDERGLGLGLRRGRWKLFVAPDEGRAELYDVVNDPGETRNLASDHPERVSEMTGLLTRWQSDWPASGGGRPLRIDPSHVEALRELGYVE